jgi:hypothetical protein
VQSSDTLPITGSWFNPGTANLFWDNQNVGSTTIDVTGSFNALLTVPPTTAGQHTLILSDGAVNFCINISREPYTANDYVDMWHLVNFTVNLQSDWPISEVFYRINGGEVCNVTANGEPEIANEGTANTLEYWSTWNTIETTLNESRHVTLSGIRLDKTAPSCTISTNLVATSTNIVLSLSADDATSGVAQMRFSNDGYTWSSWVAYQTMASWTLSQGDGLKTVYVQFSDNAGLTSTYSCAVTLQTPQPMSTRQVAKVPTATPPTIPTAAPTAQPFTVTEPSPTPAVPELSFLMVSVLMSLSTVLAVVILKNRK